MGSEMCIRDRVVVTSVSSLVHIYSIGYMSHDPHKPRFMAYLSLFTFAMLTLVTSDNFLQLFFGWEGVGLCSYLLIGFWYKKNSANSAAIKAFIVNRVGDFGFALGIFLIFYSFNTLYIFLAGLTTAIFTTLITFMFIKIRLEYQLTSRLPYQIYIFDFMVAFMASLYVVDSLNVLNGLF